MKTPCHRTGLLPRARRVSFNSIASLGIVLTVLGVVSSRADILYIGAPEHENVLKVDSGGNISSYTTLDPITKAGDIAQPAGLAFDSVGTLHVVETYNGRIERYAPGGAQLGDLANTNAGMPEVFSGAPVGLALDNAGNFYVANGQALFSNIVKFSPTGVYLGEFVTGLNTPYALAFDSAGNLYVSCYVPNGNSGVIRRFSAAGVDLGIFASTSELAHDLAFDRMGQLFASFNDAGTIRKFSATGTDLGVFATIPDVSTFGTGVVYGPLGLAFDSAGNLYAASSGTNNAIFKYTPDGTASVFAVGTGANGLIGPNFLAFTDDNGVPLPLVNQVAPIVLSNVTSAITSTGATLNSRVNPNRKATTAQFQYGTTTAYGNTASVSLSQNNGTSAQAVSVTLNGLMPGTTYHYQLTATNNGGTSNGGDRTFTTLTEIESWRQKWFGMTANSGNSADSADPYHTGVSNLVGFAFFGPNQDPALARISQLPQPQLIGGNIGFSFTQPVGVNGVVYSAEWSKTLQANDWHAITESGTGSQHVFNAPTGSNTRLFLRLTVTSP